MFIQHQENLLYLQVLLLLIISSSLVAVEAAHLAAAVVLADLELALVLL